MTIVTLHSQAVTVPWSALKQIDMIRKFLRTCELVIATASTVARLAWENG